MRALRQGWPSDSHTTYANVKIVREWKKHFPEASECPPVIYLDLWPIMPEPFAMIVDPALASQLTQETPQPRHPIFKWAQVPITGGLDLLSADPVNHKLWRSRLIPGFSPRNLATHVPAMIEEVQTFADIVKSKAGKGGDWGDMFTFYDKTVALTFDVITNTPGPMLLALRALISYAKFNSLPNRLERLTPKYKRVIGHNSKIMADVLLPQIVTRLAASDAPRSQKTIIDMAIQEVKNSGQSPSSDFIDIVASNIKMFLFAGHDTTAQTLSWVYWELQRHPEVLAKMRAEHDEKLGTDPRLAKEVLSENHHRLSDLRYTAAVIRETLRLRTPAGTLRQTSPDFRLVDKHGVVYPTRNTVTQTIPTVIHVRPEFWPRPTEFVPERFLVPDDHPLHPAKNAYRPFELGSTRCIGEEMAMMEMKLALVFTLRELDFDFNYALWDKVIGRAVPPGEGLVYGQRAYRAGQGIGHIKDNLPARVRWRAVDNAD
ncbi:Cytochrome P450 monooxygenase aflN [Apiospora kogelbergensis]|uniref:Cytochrome P450 monooxygenase aflN n=1 Tax=Apiospora kogelbergensis TaxID=1337665 RepID=A0AAW0R4Z5_9PEZI